MIFFKLKFWCKGTVLWLANYIKFIHLSKAAFLRKLIFKKIEHILFQKNLNFTIFYIKTINVHEYYFDFLNYLATQTLRFKNSSQSITVNLIIY